MESITHTDIAMMIGRLEGLMSGVSSDINNLRSTINAELAKQDVMVAENRRRINSIEKFNAIRVGAIGIIASFLAWLGLDGLSALFK